MKWYGITWHDKVYTKYIASEVFFGIAKQQAKKSGVETTIAIRKNSMDTT